MFPFSSWFFPVQEGVEREGRPEYQAPEKTCDTAWLFAAFPRRRDIIYGTLFQAEACVP
jgi:hypothetical protein